MKAPKQLTVKALRELAKKHLKSGYSKLTRTELVEKLKAYVPALKGAAASMTERLPRARRAAASAEKRAKPAATKKKKAAVATPAKREAAAKQAKPTARAAKAPTPARKGARGAAAAAKPAPAPTAAEPVVEGFFVARIAGEEEARRHSLMQPASPPGPQDDPEGLGALPERYDDDDAVALPRDPETLFVFWSFRPQTREAGARGLDRPRAVLRVFDGDALVREADFAFESGRYYLHGLPAGRAYRVEAHFVGRDGRSRRVGTATNTVELPRSGPSLDRRIRFARLPWSAHPTSLRRILREGGVQLRMVAQSAFEVARLALPGSVGVLPWAASPSESSGWTPPSPSGRAPSSR